MKKSEYRDAVRTLNSAKKHGTDKRVNRTKGALFESTVTAASHAIKSMAKPCQRQIVDRRVVDEQGRMRPRKAKEFFNGINSVSI